MSHRWNAIKSALVEEETRVAHLDQNVVITSHVRKGQSDKIHALTLLLWHCEMIWKEFQSSLLDQKNLEYQSHT